MADPYLTVAEAMAYLKVNSRSNLYRLIQEHRLPFCRCGRAYRFDRAELDAWLHGHGTVIDMRRALKRGA